MSSSIDATKPVNGVPAVKSELRANLAGAKTEIDHGGFFTQVGVPSSPVGQVERTTEARLNDLPISVRDYGAVGDNTSRPVSQWLSGGARDRGYANLAAIQVDFPHVTSLTDEIDWAAIQKALTVGSQFGGTQSRRIDLPNGIYMVNKTIQIDRHEELVGQGVNASWIKATAAFTSGPCILIQPIPTTAYVLGGVVRDLFIDATLVPESNITNHGIEFYRSVQSSVCRVSILLCKGYGILMWNGAYFNTVDNVKIDRSFDSAICLRNGFTGSTDGYGEGTSTANGNHFSNLFIYLNYGVTNPRIRIPRLIDIMISCHGNFFSDIQVQTGIYRLDDCWIFMGGTQNVIERLHAYDGPGISRTCTSSSGTAGVIRLTFAFIPNLMNADKVAVTGITGLTPGTLYTLTQIGNLEMVFEIAGTTYSGSPQTGRITRGASITATVAGGASRIQCTCANHGLYTGQEITVTGITGGSGTQRVIRIDRNTFQLAGTTFSSGSTGTWVIDRPSSLVQFGDMGYLDNHAGTKNVIRHMRLVMNHDASTLVYAALFTGLASYNLAQEFVQDQSGNLRPYLVENSATLNVVSDWPTIAVPAGPPLYQFSSMELDIAQRVVESGYGWNSASKPAVGERLTGRYQLSFLTNAAVDPGDPVFVRPGLSGYGYRTQVRNVDSLNHGVNFWGAVFRPDGTDAAANEYHEVLAEGFIDVPDLDPTGRSIGDPVYLTTNGYTFTVPSTHLEHCVLVGFLSDITGTNSRLFVRRSTAAWDAAFGRLGMRKLTSNPTLAVLRDAEVCFAVVGGVGKLMIRDGATIYVWNNASTIT